MTIKMGPAQPNPKYHPNQTRLSADVCITVLLHYWSVLDLTYPQVQQLGYCCKGH
jgi:hypothetical protein